MAHLKQILCFICLLTSLLNNAQSKNRGAEILDKLISEKEFVKADSVLKASISELTAKKSYYLLTDYIYYTGKIKSELQNESVSKIAVNQLVEFIKSATDSLKVLRQAELELSSYYE
ncbi:MAG: hypothetical protein KDC68_06095, partial [Gelidibacter sp.]|nr:hypothetical protein [Gelidibacter sp.]